MEKRIVYTRPDGGVSVVIPVKHDSKAIALVLKKDVPVDAVNIKTVNADLVPTDRTFRGAWEDDPTESPEPIKVNMSKARGLHMDRIRAARDKELARLDIEQLKGSDVAAEKQILRDIPTVFDLSGAATPDALKTLWPSELPV